MDVASRGREALRNAPFDGSPIVGEEQVGAEASELPTVFEKRADQVLPGAELPIGGENAQVDARIDQPACLDLTIEGDHRVAIAVAEVICELSETPLRPADGEARENVDVMSRGAGH
jgi:hypothetical protein